MFGELGRARKKSLGLGCILSAVYLSFLKVGLGPAWAHTSVDMDSVCGVAIHAVAISSELEGTDSNSDLKCCVSAERESRWRIIDMVQYYRCACL